MKEAVKREFFPAWIRNLGLEPGPAWLYVCLLSRRDIKTGLAWPTVETLAFDTGMGRATIHRHLAALVSNGYITRASGNSNASNRYMVWEPGSNMPVPAKYTAQMDRLKMRQSTVSKRDTDRLKMRHHHIPEIKTKDHNQYSPTTSGQRSNDKLPALGKPEIEAILERMDLPDATYGHIHARMDAMGWRTPEGSFFRSPVSTKRFLAGLERSMSP